MLVFHSSYTCNGTNDLKDSSQISWFQLAYMTFTSPLPSCLPVNGNVVHVKYALQLILLWHLITHLRQVINTNAFSAWNSADKILLLQYLVKIIVRKWMQWRATYGLIKEKFTTDWMVQGLNPNVDKIFCIHPDQAWGPHSLPYNKHQVFFPQIQHPGHGINHPPPSSTEVKERVQLHLYSPSRSSWPVLVWLYILLYKKNSQWLVLWDQIYAFITFVYDLETAEYAQHGRL